MRREASKNFKTSTGFERRDLAIPVRRSNQLRYEATDVGSWSFVDSSVPAMMNEPMNEIIYEMNHILNGGYQIK